MKRQKRKILSGDQVILLKKRIKKTKLSLLKVLTFNILGLFTGVLLYAPQQGYKLNDHKYKHTSQISYVNEPIKTIVKDSLLRLQTSLQNEKRFWRNKLQMANNNRINLALDLVDSLLYIEIQGVKLRQCKILRFALNDKLDYAPRNGSEINTLQMEWSNIPKIPVIKREVKRGEALEELIYEIPPADSQNVHTILKFTHVDIELFGIDDYLLDIYPLCFIQCFNLGNECLDKHCPVLNALPDDCQNRILVEVANRDARAIYRALQADSQLALRI